MLVQVALRESEAQLRLVTDNVPAMIAYIDRDLVIRFANRPYAEFVGLPQGEIIGKNITIKGIASGSRNMLAQALDVFAKNGLSMTIDREFAFTDAPDAYRHLESATHMGKVLIRVN